MTLPKALTPGAPAGPVWSDRAARFYAEALDRSDYASAAAAVLRAKLGVPACLLDIGAGAGQPVAAWLPPTARWTAIEPSRYLRARLDRLRRTTHPELGPVNATWEKLPDIGLHEVALAANVGGPLAAPREMLALMRSRASRAVAWIVPAQRGPRRWCLAGALPPDLHGEDERPGVAQVLEALGPAARSDRSATFPWTFRARFAGAAAAQAHCAAQLRLAPGDPRHAALATHVTAALAPLPCGGVELAAPKLSALLVWDLA